MNRDLTHMDKYGRVKMVDVTEKPVVRRTAIASGYVEMAPATLELVMKGEMSKGDLFNAARIAGIMGAKRASDLIPLCHPLPLTKIQVEVRPDPDLNRIFIQSEVVTEARTGVEMEALTAVSIAALAIYDMAKAVDKEMVIGDIKLVEKKKEPCK